MRSLWGENPATWTQRAHSVASVREMEEVEANCESGIVAFGAALLEDVSFTGSPEIGGERAHGVRGLNSGISVGGSPPCGNPAASGRGSLFGASPSQGLLTVESSGLGSNVMASPGSFRGTALSGSPKCELGPVTGIPASGSPQTALPRILLDAFAPASPSMPERSSLTFTERNASVRRQREISETQSVVIVSPLSEAYATETATVRNRQSWSLARMRAASSRASLRDLFHLRGEDLVDAETVQGDREVEEIGEGVGQHERGAVKWRDGRSRGRRFNDFVEGLLGKFKKERPNVSGSGVGVRGTHAVA
ncbi:hypothetical protein BC830DRAFT_1149530 [Chytriomyces sp. MP71]|nr:hypothetical protein BC830DRAFT_1149530 [Chytriomyces sp. MP71]